VSVNKYESNLDVDNKKKMLKCLEHVDPTRLPKKTFKCKKVEGPDRDGWKIQRMIYER
jgi:hypothetical protein